MWCRNCQQDVPAVARGANSPLVCPRCEEDLPVLAVAADSTFVGEVSDMDIGPDSCQQPADENLSDGLPFEKLAQEQLQLRRIARKLGSARRESKLNPGLPGMDRSGSDSFEQESSLPGNRTSLRIDWAHEVSPLAITTHEKPIEAPVADRSDARVAAIGYHTHSQPARTTVSWIVSLLIFGGVFSLTCGIGLLAHATITGYGTSMPGGSIWLGGLTITLAGVGMLMVGLTWMAIRLWRHGRRVNQQLQGVDRQLAELQYQLDAKHGMRTSTSAAYYDHFAQGASSPMLLANLRGGLDQLAKRMK